MGVLLVAAKKEKVDDYKNVVTQAGRIPGLVDVDVFALQNCYEVNYEPADDEVVTLLNIGASTMNVNIIKGTPAPENSEKSSLVVFAGVSRSFSPNAAFSAFSHATCQPGLDTAARPTPFATEKMSKMILTLKRNIRFTDVSFTAVFKSLRSQTRQATSMASILRLQALASPCA